MFTNKTPWIILLVLWATGSIWWHVCQVKQLCAETTQPSVDNRITTVSPSSIPVMTITDGDRLQLELPSQYSFAASGVEASQRTVGPALDSLSSYLKANPTRTLQIMGYYSLTETNPAGQPNLGLARAEAIKQYLVRKGVSATAITTQSAEKALSFSAAGDSLYGGLGFSFSEILATTEDTLAAAEKFTSVLEPIDLYFPAGQAQYINTPDTERFFKEARTYLAQHPAQKLKLIGHTDSSGPDALNMTLSLNRANVVNHKLRQTGIPASQLIVEGKGETQPKADNSTLAGRKANRRVTVTIL